ncbi:hypothetical protein GCM10027046_31540 [Uliginosibacterium flavum]|uniref:SPOR domain-containing protein n=1 Tax=Uliginosibacterium flavum TaxID=1396831 RepID=A0ABV2TTC6_9RHOO
MLDQGVQGREGDRAHARRKIVVRAAVTAGLIAALLASLLMFEQPKLADDVPQPPEASSPEIGVAVSGGAASLSEDVQAAIQAAPDMAQAELASMSSSVESPVVTLAAPVVPEGSKDVSVKPILSISPQPVALRTEPRTGKPANGDRLLIDVPKPLPAASASTPASSVKVATAAPAAALASGGFVVQLGVFNNSTNAEELRAKLKLAGIPSQLETRVQVGPFASKDEAVKAQEKLRTLGLGGGMLVLPKKP